ncbi:ScbA/BarX family gamma-butyrolactone biosynthesis protein [Streptomyces sp. NPDC050504]|uniref:ScbA/BarX family gamma-butyrolactone biosynthesis protein n=1 Tax=Streptomyces sp. NPDC050504 TaxID=3365618 RepID=UPI0037B65556
MTLHTHAVLPQQLRSATTEEPAVITLDAPLGAPVDLPGAVPLAMPLDIPLDIAVEIPVEIPAERLRPPVEKSLVNRTRAADVLPVGWERHSDTKFTVGVRWPLKHRYFGPQEGRYSSQLILETIRQCGLLLSYAELGVPTGHHFVMWDLRHRAWPRRLLTGGTDAMIDVEVQVTDLRMRGGSPGEVTLQMVLRRGERIVAAGSTRYSLMSPAAYRRMRGGAVPLDLPAPLPQDLPTAVEPASVCRKEHRDVVLSPGECEGQWLLRADTSNPSLFDHANDHIPGMVLVEAAHQAAQSLALRAPFVPGSSELSFTRYAEFGVPIRIEAQPTGDGGLRVTGLQDGNSLFTAQFDGDPTAG